MTLLEKINTLDRDGAHMALIAMAGMQLHETVHGNDDKALYLATCLDMAINIATPGTPGDARSLKCKVSSVQSRRGLKAALEASGKTIHQGLVHS